MLSRSHWLAPLETTSARPSGPMSTRVMEPEPTSMNPRHVIRDPVDHLDA
jgi:hypothetical protein